MKTKSHYDLSKAEGSITSGVEALIGKMSSMNESEIREEFLSILHSDTTHVSAQSIKKWEIIMSRVNGKFAVMKTITNLYLAGCNLSSASI